MCNSECGCRKCRGQEDHLEYDPDKEAAVYEASSLDTIVQTREGTASGLAAGEMQNVREVRPQREQCRRGGGYLV